MTEGIYKRLDELVDARDVLALYELREAIDNRIRYIEGYEDELPIVSEL